MLGKNLILNKVKPDACNIFEHHAANINYHANTPFN
jgi:hypothetical protein